MTDFIPATPIPVPGRPQTVSELIHNEAVENFEPNVGKVLVRRREAATTAGVIAIPDSAVARANEGTVLSAGTATREGDVSKSLDFRIGDRVLLSAYGGHDVIIGGEKLLLIPDQDILGILGNVFYDEPENSEDSAVEKG